MLLIAHLNSSMTPVGLRWVKPLKSMVRGVLQTYMLMSLEWEWTR